VPGDNVTLDYGALLTMMTTPDPVQLPPVGTSCHNMVCIKYKKSPWKTLRKKSVEIDL
jgi:hypothetical protein